MAVPQASMGWIRDGVDPDAPEATHIVLGVDCGEQAGSGDRVVSLLLNLSMESDEGVFSLLPHDLCYEASRSVGLVTVELFTTLNALTAVGVLDADADASEWVKVLSATIPFPEDDALPGPPLVVIDHEGVVGLDELLASIPEAGVHIVGPKPFNAS